jgi:hypothetical protein
VHATDKKQLSPFAHFRFAGAKATSCFLPKMQALYGKNLKFSVLVCGLKYLVFLTLFLSFSGMWHLKGFVQVAY